MSVVTTEQFIGLKLADRDIFCDVLVRNIMPKKAVGVSIGIGLGMKTAPAVVVSSSCEHPVGVGYCLDTESITKDNYIDHKSAFGVGQDITVVCAPILVSIPFSHGIGMNAELSSKYKDVRMEFRIGTGMESEIVSGPIINNIEHCVGANGGTEIAVYRKRMLSDLSSATLADLDDMMMQELYWVEKS